MSKRNKKKDDQVQPPKYQNENMIEDLSGKITAETSEVDRLKLQLDQAKTDMYHKGQEYIKGTAAVGKKLEDKIRENVYLNNEITQIREDRELFEAECKKNFEEKFKKVEAEQKAIVAKVNLEMETLKEDLVKQKTKKKDLKAMVKKLTAEVERLNNVNRITIQNYEKSIAHLKEEHFLKLKTTTEIFENFLKNNQELLTTDLYTVYRNLKVKFDSKLTECLDYKKKNTELNDQNRLLRISMDSNDEIINECAKIQIMNKKKNKQLVEEINEKNKLIEKIKGEYQKQVDEITEKCSLLIQGNEGEITQLKNALYAKNKELEELRAASQAAINQKSEIELFFIDALKNVRQEIVEQRKKESIRKSCMFPYINQSTSVSQINDNDDSIYVTSLKKVEIKDMDPESKEKVLRTLLNQINTGKKTKNFVKLRQLLN